MSVSVDLRRHHKPWGVNSMTRAQRTTTLHSHEVAAVQSALECYLRRGAVDAAVYCALEFDAFVENPQRSFVINKMVNRLIEFTLTYLGISAPQATHEVISLLSVYRDHYAEWRIGREVPRRRHVLIDAVTFLARAPKHLLSLGVPVVFLNDEATSTDWLPPSTFDSDLGPPSAGECRAAGLSKRAVQALCSVKARFVDRKGAAMPPRLEPLACGFLAGLDVQSARAFYWLHRIIEERTLETGFSFDLVGRPNMTKKSAALFVAALCIDYFDNCFDEDDELSNSGLRTWLVKALLRGYWDCPPATRTELAAKFAVAVALVAVRGVWPNHEPSVVSEDYEPTRIAALMAHRRSFHDFVFQMDTAVGKEMHRSKWDYEREMATITNEGPLCASESFRFAIDSWTRYREQVERDERRVLEAEQQESSTAKRRRKDE